MHGIYLRWDFNWADYYVSIEWKAINDFQKPKIIRKIET